MITLREVESAIQDLEQGSATYNNCMKLAALYIIRDEMKKGKVEYTRYPYYGYNYDHHPYDREKERMYYHPGDRSIGYCDNEDLIIRKEVSDKDWR